MRTKVFAFFAGAACIAAPAVAQISFTNVNDSYFTNWDNLSTTVNATWINNVGFPGWHLFNWNGGATINTINLNSGGLNGGNGTGSFYSFGSTGSLDRALGGVGAGGAYFNSPASGAIAAFITFAVTNNTGSSLGSATIAFDGEQWRNGGNTSAQTMVFEYGFGASFASVATWFAPGGNFDWSSPVTGASAAAVDGNAAGLVAGRGGVLSNLNWSNGDTLWVRWIERNDTGNDHGLGIDNFSLTVPGPAAPILLGLGLLARARRRR
jgi:hypothetical protein